MFHKWHYFQYNLYILFNYSIIFRHKNSVIFVNNIILVIKYEWYKILITFLKNEILKFFWKILILFTNIFIKLSIQIFLLFPCTYIKKNNSFILLLSIFHYLFWVQQYEISKFFDHKNRFETCFITNVIWSKKNTGNSLKMLLKFCR